MKNALQKMGGIETVLNGIRAEASANFQEMIPELNANNFAEYATGMLNNHDVFNEWADALINRIGLVVIKTRSWENPLAFLKKGMLEFGDTVEEIFTDVIAEKTYQATMGQETAGEIYASAVPDIYAVFHKENRQGRFDVTVNEPTLRKAFVSLRALEDFINSTISNLIKSDNLTEFEYMKALLTSYGDKGLFKLVNVEKPTNKSSVDLLLEQVKAYSRKFTFLSREYNAFSVMTSTPLDDQVVILSAELDAKIDVQSLASAFNLDKIEFLPRRIVLDEMPVKDAHLILMSKELFMIHDTRFEIRDIYNPQTLEYKYFLHHWQILSTSRFENAVAFTSAETITPTSITYTATGAKVKGATLPGKTVVKGMVKTVDDEGLETETEVELNDVAVIYSVIGNKSPNTKVGSNGFLQIGTDETATKFTVNVKALYHDIDTSLEITVVE